MKKEDYWILFSNFFLVLPVIFATLYHQWLYCFFAVGLCIFSPLFHWYRITDRKSVYFLVSRILDWLFALAAFIYMYYFIYHHTVGKSQTMLSVLLSLIVLFFLYGWLFGNYKKLHPWFHIMAPIVSSIILIVAH